RAGAGLAVLARAEQGSDALIAGSIGPLLAPSLRDAEIDGDADDAVLEQVEALVAGGVDLLMFETFGNLAHLVRAVQAAQRSTRVPIIAQMTFLEDGRTIGGDRPEVVARAFEDLGVAAIGVNCTLGPQGVGQVLDELVESTDLPLSALPNAGIPARVHGQFHYPANEEYFARAARHFVERGAAIVGGCCGTTPAHIAAVARAVSPPVKRPRRVGTRPTVVTSVRPAKPMGPIAARLASTAFTVACELPPNLGTDGDVAVEAASALVNAGVDVLVIPPPRSSRPQIGPVPLGLLLRSRLGVETILTATTWDKSLLGLQADLLGAHAFDLRTVICRTGGPIPHGDYPNGAGIWDVDSVGLIELLRSLNESERPGGPQSSPPLSFQIGASVNPNAPDLKAELRYARRKVDAGAHFLVTHPVFELEGLRQVVAELDRPAVPILVGVMPLRDFEHAEYLHQEVPDIDLPTAVLERMRRAGSDGVRVGQDIATELVAEAAGLVQGLVMSPATSQLSETGETLQALLGVVADRR
ncbi:MAG: homocysteine S-methyltransferase family protein, partial [Acidimicrobiaceae bacterium]|nr:homocysteine S-methyltransferase family protein [Acidimicrobiaceae bacterium]